MDRSFWDREDRLSWDREDRQDRPSLGRRVDRSFWDREDRLSWDLVAPLFLGPVGPNGLVELAHPQRHRPRRRHRNVHIRYRSP